jgi:hypothetical protein
MDAIHYTKCEVTKEETTRWTGTVKDYLLRFEIVFSPKQIELIEQYDWYDQTFLSFHYHGTSYRIRNMITNPCKQAYSLFRLSYGDRLYISEEYIGSLRERNSDARSAVIQLEDFRWQCIRAAKRTVVPMIEYYPRGKHRRQA